METAIQTADKRLVYLTGDENAIRAYEMRAKAMSDWTSEYNHATRTGFANGMEQGLQQGIIQGLEQGHIEKELEIARKMKTAGLSLTKINRFTGLSSEIVKEL